MSKLITKTQFKIPKMDCPSEENIIRMKLVEVGAIQKLNFNLQERILEIFHEDQPEVMLSYLEPLGFGAKIESSESISINSEDLRGNVDESQEARVLKILLIINGIMFFAELTAGLIGESMGLISDSLDMLADSTVYAVSLYAVGKTIQEKRRSAKINGTFQFILAMGVMIETLRRFYFGSEPEPPYMIGVSILALAANVFCLLLLAKHRNGEVHMKASWICSSTDVMANIGVILAGVLVLITGSPIPDLVISIIVALIVLRGSMAILKVSKA